MYALGARQFDPFVTPDIAGLLAARPERTVWTWQQRGKVASACDVRTRRVKVRLEDVVAKARAGEVRFLDPRHATRRRPRVA